MNHELSQTYRIVSLIGQGGMSKVYLAEHVRLHTRWAIKEVSKHQGARFDFLAEANILKRLQHPMLPRIVDIYEDEQNIYIVEDFVEGMTLEDVLKDKGKVEEATLLQWFRDLCQVLDYLHGQNPNPIIYRDMKPSNVMIQPDGSIKLIDFGIAREYKQDSGADTTYIGTKGYAAPEQFGKAQTDGRTDIYSLGVTMYHLATGKSPYEPPYQFVPARSLEGTLSHGLEHILDKCVQSEPQDRYQSVKELLQDLTNIHRFDKAFRRVRQVNLMRGALVAVLLAISLTMIFTGRSLQIQAKEDSYAWRINEGFAVVEQNPESAMSLFSQAQELFPERPDSGLGYVYALFRSGDYGPCIENGKQLSAAFPGELTHLPVMASAYYELNDYTAAAEYFRQGAEKSLQREEYLRNYAVCLGRTGELEEAQRILELLIAQGAQSDATHYVQGEVYYAQKLYAQAEGEFFQVLDAADDRLLSRAYLSLAETYRDAARTSPPAIEDAAQRSANLIAQALQLPQLRNNTVLFEMQGDALYRLAEESGDTALFVEAAESFEQVLALGVQNSTLFENAALAYQRAKDYSAAKRVLDWMHETYSDLYTPLALKAIILIQEENEKVQSARNYTPAYELYQQAQTQVRTDDETTRLQQLESLISQLRNGGWLK